MSQTTHSRWLHRFAVLTAGATLALIGIGGLVTSHEAGMAVPDWPTSYGYNMFALPIHLWQGGIFYEHTHRLWATFVGVLVVTLTRWLGGRAARRPLILIGIGEVLAGIGVFSFWPGVKGAGHFLTGIGTVVLLAGLVPARNSPARRPLPLLGWLLFALVQIQGLLGGLRVVLLMDKLGIFHAALAQLFFAGTCVVALLTSGTWVEVRGTRFGAGGVLADLEDGQTFGTGGTPGLRSLRRLFFGTTALILIQLILGATMRHEHAGLAIPDFPLAYGKLWPATDTDSVARYNQHRMETTGVNPITGFQIQLQMGHRIVAVLILAAVVICAWRVREFGRSRGREVAGAGESPHRPPPHAGGDTRSVTLLRRLSLVWLGLILCQVALGAATVLSNKAADLATAHVLAGALSLATGGLLCIVSCCNSQFTRPAVVVPEAGARSRDSSSWATGTAAT